MINEKDLENINEEYKDSIKRDYGCRQTEYQPN